jgi:hypothetical protein
MAQRNQTKRYQGVSTGPKTKDLAAFWIRSTANTWAHLLQANTKRRWTNLRIATSTRIAEAGGAPSDEDTVHGVKTVGRETHEMNHRHTGQRQSGTDVVH